MTPQETEQLFRILAALKQRGVTVVLITHKLREIMAVTDTVHVMRAVSWWRTPYRRHHARRAGRVDGRSQGAAADRQGGGAAGRRATLRRASLAGRQPRCARAGRRLVRAARRRDRRHRGCFWQWANRAAAAAGGDRGANCGSIAIGGQMFGATRPGDPAGRRALAWRMCRRIVCARGWCRPFRAAESSILGYQHETRFARGACSIRRPSVVIVPG